MLEIYSPSGQEEKIGLFLRDKLTEFGLKNARIDKVGNVLGEIGIAPPTILLCGHMDTVPGQLQVKIEDNNLYGRGAVDAKSSLASMILASSHLTKRELDGRVIVACVVDEEKRGKGIRHLLKKSLDVQYAIFGEPSGVKNITIGYKGRVEVKILCETEPGHVGAAHLFENAVEKAFKFWSFMKESLPDSKKESDSLFHSVTACLTGIRGGEAPNIVPHRCELYIDIRLPPNLHSQNCVDWLSSLTREYEAKNPGVKLKFSVGDKVEPFLADKSSVLVRELSRSIRATLKGPVRLLRKTGTGDMNVFASKMSVPAVTYGPGNSRLSHTLNEYIKIDDFLASIEVYKATIMKILSRKSS